MSMQGMAGQGESFTPRFEYLRGEFDLGEARLPYFTLSLRVEDALKYISLPQDVVFDATQPIAIEELFQRELNKERVHQKLVPYLKSPQKLKFFNSFTVALLPSDPERHATFLNAFPGPIEKDTINGFNRMRLGPVLIDELQGNSSIGFVQWDSRRCRAVVLDGQHRLYGLKQVAEDNTFRWRGDLLESRIPIILLVLHKEVGYRAPDTSFNDSGQNILSACRAVFIDLNKHSVRVSPDRQYLLDDLDVHAVSMRAIMEKTAGSVDTRPIRNRWLSSGRIPLALIDWSSGKAKFDVKSNSLYLTTTSVLYDHVVSALSLPQYKGTDYKAAKKFLDRLTSRLDLAMRDPELNDELYRHFHNCEEDQVPFALLEAHVERLSDHFRSVIGPLLVQTLMLLQPYAELVRALEDHGFLSGPREAWLALDEVGKAAFPVDDGAERPGSVAKAIVDEIKQTYQLAYQVVFQRAFIDAVLGLADNQPEIAEELGWPSDREAFLSHVYSEFNRVIAPHLLVQQDDDQNNDGGATPSDVWVGAGLRANKTTDFAKASQNAIAGLVTTVLLAPLNEFKDMEPSAVGDWVADRIRRGPKVATVDAVVSQRAKHWKQKLTAVIRDELRAADREVPDADGMDALFRQRAGHVLTRFAG